MCEGLSLDGPRSCPEGYLITHSRAHSHSQEMPLLHADGHEVWLVVYVLHERPLPAPEGPSVGWTVVARTARVRWSRGRGEDLLYGV